MAPATLFKFIDNMYAAMPHAAPPRTTTSTHRRTNSRQRHRFQTIKHTFRFDPAVPRTPTTHPTYPTHTKAANLVPLTFPSPLPHNPTPRPHAPPSNRNRLPPLLKDPQRFSAPCTVPTILYRLLKNVNHSFNTVCSLSPRSLHAGLQSSGFSDDVASAREASLPAKTAWPLWSQLLF